MTTGLPFPPAAVEIGFELLATRVELFSGVGVSMLGEAEGSTEGSSEGLAVASGGGRKGGTCCCALEPELLVLEFSGAG